MAFSWSESIVAGTTTIKKAHIDELRTNIDTLLISFGMGAYAWNRTITQNVTTTANFDWFQLQMALDQAHSANVCSTDNVTDNTTHWHTHYSSNNAAQFTSHYDTYNSAYNGSNYAYWAAHYTSYA